MVLTFKLHGPEIIVTKSLETLDASVIYFSFACDVAIRVFENGEGWKVCLFVLFEFIFNLKQMLYLKFFIENIKCF